MCLRQEAEEDEGGVAEFISDISDKLTKTVEDKIAKELEKIVAAAGAGALVGGAVGAVIGAVAAAVLTEVFDWISGAFEDDLFEPTDLSVQVSSPVDTFLGQFETTRAVVLREKDGDGLYDVRFAWRLSL
jgi:hypothetical protein